MNIYEVIGAACGEASAALSDDDVADVVYRQVMKDLRSLIVAAVAHHRRYQVRAMERTATVRHLMKFMGPATSFLPETRLDRERAMRLLAKGWRLGDGQVVEIGKATLPEIEQRLAMLRKLRDGLNQSIAFLEQVKDELVRTGARCLYDLIDPEGGEEEAQVS